MREPEWRSEGDDPDYRFTLANERTFLAWIRTALAILAGGVLLHQFATRARSAHRVVIALDRARRRRSGAQRRVLHTLARQRDRDPSRPATAVQLGAARARRGVPAHEAVLAVLFAWPDRSRAMAAYSVPATGDPGLQPERTALAWSRTALALAVNALLALRAGFIAGEPLLIAVGVVLFGTAGAAIASHRCVAGSFRATGSRSLRRRARSRVSPLPPSSPAWRYRISSWRR